PGHLREPAKCFEKELLGAASGGYCTRGRHHERDVGATASDRIESHVALTSHEQLCRAGHAFDAIEMGDKPDPPRHTIPRAAESARDDRAEAVGADSEPCADGPSRAITLSHDSSAYCATVVHQLLHRGALEQQRTCLQRAPSEGRIEDASRDGKP